MLAKDRNTLVGVALSHFMESAPELFTYYTFANRLITAPCSIRLALSYRGTTQNKSWITAECDNIRVYCPITRYRAVHRRG